METTRPARDSSPEHFQYVNALRGYAILGVIFGHLAQSYNLHTSLIGGSLIIGLGIGVQLFYVASAFTLFHSLSIRVLREKHYVITFFIRRFSRIAPLYWYGIALYFAIYGNDSRGWLPGPDGWWHYLLNVLFLHGLFPATMSSVVPGGWSIGIEMLFYLIVPTLFCYLSSIKKALIFTLVTVLIAPAINTMALYLLGSYMSQYTSSMLIDIFWFRWLPNQLGCFSFGILLFHILRHPQIVLYIESKKINTCLLMFSIISFIILLKYGYILSCFKHFVFSLVFMIFALCLATHHYIFFVNRIIAFIGTVSFSCYINHFLIIAVIKSMFSFTLLHSHPILNVIIFMTISAITISITVGVSYVTYSLIESQGIKLGKKLIRTKFPVIQSGGTVNREDCHMVTVKI